MPPEAKYRSLPKVIPSMASYAAPDLQQQALLAELRHQLLQSKARRMKAEEDAAAAEAKRFEEAKRTAWMTAVAGAVIGAVVATVLTVAVTLLLLR